jgi:beta-lactamase regulating signal transducer with metallopeptidase domain
MSWLLLQSLIPQHIELQNMARTSVESMLNALPEGCLIAFFAWILLRVLRKQNSGTRFAVWFVTLLAVAAVAVVGGLRSLPTLIPARMSSAVLSSISLEKLHPAITIPGRWAQFAMLAWAIGASVAMARLAVGLWQLHRLRLSCKPVVISDLDPAVRQTVETIIGSQKLGSRFAKSDISRPITIATSDQVRVPAAIGLWKRTIVLPAWALNELPPEDLNAILLHEFAHLRRGDDWTNLIQKIVHALFFFHPAVWWIEKQLSVEREMACDDAVLAETANPHGYATCLVSLLEKSLAHRLPPTRLSMAHAAVRRAREASLRLARILDTKRPKAMGVWKPALGIVSVFSLFCFAVAPVAPQLIAFDQGRNHSFIPASGHAQTMMATATSTGSAYTAASSPPLVIPAALRVPAQSATTKTLRPRVETNAAAASTVDRHEREPARALAARLSMGHREPVANVAAKAGEEIVPAIQTLVFFETTSYTTNGSTVWSVQVWHVMLLTQNRAHAVKVPVINSL